MQLQVLLLHEGSSSIPVEYYQRLNATMVTSGVEIIKKWELFRATDYLSLMWPCFELSRIWGLFPFKIDNQNSIVLSKPGSAYSTIVATLHVIAMGIVLYLIDVSGDLEYDSVPGNLQGNCYLILGWWIAIVSFIQNSKRLTFLQDLDRVAFKVPSRSFRKLSKFVHAKDILGFIFLIAQSANAYSKDIPLFASKLLSVHTTIVVYLMDHLYVNCVLVIGLSFKAINEKLLALKANIEREEPHLLRRVYHEKCNPLILMEIRAIKNQHNDISELIHRLNRTFSFQLVATVTLTFAEITFSLYFYILQLLGMKGINREKQFWYSYFTTSATYYAVKVTEMVWACEVARDEAVRTGVVVHELLLDTFDKQVKEELQLFSLQILHRDNTFSARGLTLDAALLTSIVGGITTYLLILIQFLVSSKSCGTIFDQADPTSS